MDRWMEGWIDRQMDGCMDEWMGSVRINLNQVLDRRVLAAYSPR